MKSLTRVPDDRPIPQYLTDRNGKPLAAKTMGELRSSRDRIEEAYLAAPAAAYAKITCGTWMRLLKAKFDGPTDDVQSKMTVKVIGPRMVKVYFTAIVRGQKITDSMITKARKIDGKPHWDIVEAAEKAAEVIGRMHNAIYLSDADASATIH